MKSALAFFGAFVLVLWLPGALGLGDFVLRFGPRVDDSKRYTCTAGDSFFTCKKHSCSFREYAEQQAQQRDHP